MVNYFEKYNHSFNKTPKFNVCINKTVSAVRFIIKQAHHSRSRHRQCKKLFQIF